MPIHTDKRGAYYNVVSVPHGVAKPEQDCQMKGCVRQIVIAFAVMVLPMLFLSGILLGLIFFYRVPPNKYVHDDLGMEQDFSDAYLVRFSATMLVTVASWSSTVAPILIGFAITLASYPAAKDMLTASNTTNTTPLPTPFQLSLIVSTMSSNPFTSLWNWSAYTFGWEGKRQSQPRALRRLTITLFMGVIFSTIVLVSDTWLHFSTKTIIFTQVGANPDPRGLGFGINANCSDEASNLDPCVDNIIYSSSDDGGTGALKILANISDMTSVLVHAESQKKYAYVATPQLSRLSSLDYTVGTYAIHSQCMPVTAQCLNATMTGALGDMCSTGVINKPDLSTGNNSYTTSLSFFKDANAFETTDGPSSNPYYWSTVIYTGMGMNLSESLRMDPDVDDASTGRAGGAIVMVNCNSFVYDVTYSSVNSSITDWRASLSNSTIVELFNVGDVVREVFTPYLYQAVGLAGFSKTGREIADKFALAYSQNALGVTAAAFEPRDAIASQERQQIQVAMVPKTPLRVLIAANLLLVVFGFVLSALALIALKGDTGEVQARLSIHALVAAAFEARAGKPVRQVEDFFEEKHGEEGPRLGFVRSMDGGWTLEKFGGDHGV